MSPPEKIDPDLIKLRLRRRGWRLYAVLSPALLVHPDAPTEFLGFARLRMAGLVSAGLIKHFQIFESRFHKVWESMLALKSASDVHFVIAAGTDLEGGFCLRAPAEGDEVLAHLTITAPRHEVLTWHQHAFHLSVRQALKAMGITHAPNPAEIHQALVTARAGLPVQRFPLGVAPRINPLHPGNAFFLRADRERLLVEAQLRNPNALAVKDELRALFAKVSAAAAEVTSGTHASPFYRIFAKNVAAAVVDGRRGPAGLRLGLPVTVLAASIVKGTDGAGRPSLGSLAASVAWHLAGIPAASFTPEALARGLQFRELAADVQKTLPALQDAGILVGEAPALRRARGFRHEGFYRHGDGEHGATSIHLAERALDLIEAEQRDVHALTLSVDRARLHEIRERLAKLRRDLRAHAASVEALGTSVWQVSWQLFPLTKPASMETAPGPSDAFVDLPTGEHRSLSFLVRELVALGSFRPDATWIARKLYPPFPTAEVQKCLQVLERSGMIAYSKAKGRFVQQTRNLKTGEVVDGLAIIDYHKEMLGFAQAASHYAKADQRESFAAAVSLPAGGKARVRDLLIAALGDVFAMAGQNSAPDALYQMNAQLLQLTCCMDQSEAVGVK